MKTIFISAMNLNLYKEYGKKFLDEFSRSAANNFLLYIVFDGPFPDEAMHIHNNIIVIPLLSSEHQIFLKKFSSLLEANGLVISHNVEKNIFKFNYDPEFNIIKFSNKPFSIYQILRYVPNDTNYLTWIDPFIMCKREFNQSDLGEFMPNENQIMTYLGRESSFSENGLLVFNLFNNGTQKYIERVINLYTTGEIFSLKRWNNSYIWDYVRIEFEKNNFIFKDISTKEKDNNIDKKTTLSQFFTYHQN
jgi:hypothetical protein